jgi:hypothetical protein
MTLSEGKFTLGLIQTFESLDDPEAEGESRATSL